MSTNICSGCNRTVEKLITMAGKLWRGDELCAECAQPIISYLHEYGLLEQAGMAHLQPQAELVLVHDKLQNSTEV